MAQIVIDHNLVAVIEQQLGDSSANVSGAAGHKDSQMSYS